MPKKFSGNYREVLIQTGLPVEFADPYNSREELQSDVEKDIKRSPFVDFNEKTFDDFEQTWTSEDVDLAYSQGNMNAGFFSTIIFNKIRTEKLYQPIPSLENKTLQFEDFVAENEPIKLTFAYYDDDGIPCGFTITASPKFPKLWAISVIKNTITSPERRDVVLFCHPAMVDDNLGKKVESKSVMPHINETIGSSSIFKLVEDVLLENGEANIEKLQTLDKRIRAGKNIAPEDNSETILTTKSEEKDSRLSPAARTAIEAGAMLGSAGIGAGVGAALGTFVFPVIGTAVGALIGGGAGAAIGISGVGLSSLFRGDLISGAGLTAVGTTALGAAIGTVLGTFVFPGVGTAIGAGIGAAIGFGATAIPALFTAIGMGIKSLINKKNNKDSMAASEKEAVHAGNDAEKTVEGLDKGSSYRDMHDKELEPNTDPSQSESTTSEPVKGQLEPPTEVLVEDKTVEQRKGPKM